MVLFYAGLANFLAKANFLLTTLRTPSTPRTSKTYLPIILSVSSNHLSCFSLTQQPATAIHAAGEQSGVGVKLLQERDADPATHYPIARSSRNSKVELSLTGCGQEIADQEWTEELVDNRSLYS